MEKREKIKAILNECLLDCDVINNVATETDVVNNLNFDSITFIQFIIMIEDEFNCVIKDDDLNYLKYCTYGDLESMILSYIEKEVL